MPKVLVHTLTARLLHWINMTAITILTLTGLYINDPQNFPFFPKMELARHLHFWFMWVLICGVTYRVVYSLISRDYKHILFRLKDIDNFPSLVRYYLFYSDTHPNYGKYNPGQKLVYTLWPVLVVLQSVTGIIMYRPQNFADVAMFLGGLAFLHTIHLLVTWIILYTVVLHIYLASINGLEMLKSMVTGYLPFNQVHYVPFPHGVNVRNVATEE